MKREIILIGPMNAGKSVLGKLLAEKLSIPQVSMDDVRWDYYDEIGYDRQEELKIREKEGLDGVLRYWKPFEVHAVERLLAEHENCVFDFGAGHTVFEDEELFARVQKALAPYENVILLIPSADHDESIRILKERDFEGPAFALDFNEHFVRHPSNERLAKHIVYTKDKTPEESCEDILKLIGDK
ncbi:MAG: shikimate kinase [Chloroflexi bacterium]|nr:shikimate kinase [Chloroflexota bacterium]